MNTPNDNTLVGLPIKLTGDYYQDMVASLEVYRGLIKRNEDLLSALRDAKSLIQGYRAGGDKDVTKRILAPIDKAIARATKKGN